MAAVMPPAHGEVGREVPCDLGGEHAGQPRELVAGRGRLRIVERDDEIMA